LVIEGQPLAGRDFGGQEAPRKHRENVPQQQTENKVKRAGAPRHEERPDHKLRAGGMFTRIHTPKGAGSFERPFRHGLAFEFFGYRLVLVRHIRRIARSRGDVLSMQEGTVFPSVSFAPAEGFLIRARALPPCSWESDYWFSAEAAATNGGVLEVIGGTAR